MTEVNYSEDDRIYPTGTIESLQISQRSIAPSPKKPIALPKDDRTSQKADRTK